MRGLRPIPILLGAAALAAAGAGTASSSRAAVSQTMHAYVHEDASIGLTFDDGSPVGNQAATPPTIPPGTYTIRAVDDAFSHNFHLSGPGVDVSTSVGETGSPTWTVTFQPGSQYRFVCDDHPDFMYGVFNTSGASSGGASGGSSASGSSSAGSGGAAKTGTRSSGSAAGAVATLAGQVNAAGKLTLTYRGRPLAKLKAGRYKLTVADKAPTRGFVLQQAGRAATTVTGAAFVGTRSLTLTLGAGKWTFSPSAGAKPAGSFTVSS
jgi:hypothetical protein